jgi:hypothetical protein
MITTQRSFSPKNPGMALADFWALWRKREVRNGTAGALLLVALVMFTNSIRQADSRAEEAKEIAVEGRLETIKVEAGQVSKNIEAIETGLASSTPSDKKDAASIGFEDAMKMPVIKLAEIPVSPELKSKVEIAMMKGDLSTIPSSPEKAIAIAQVMVEKGDLAPYLSVTDSKVAIDQFFLDVQGGDYNAASIIKLGSQLHTMLLNEDPDYSKFLATLEGIDLAESEGGFADLEGDSGGATYKGLTDAYFFGPRYNGALTARILYDYAKQSSVQDKQVNNFVSVATYVNYGRQCLGGSYSEAALCLELGYWSGPETFQDLSKQTNELLAKSKFKKGTVEYEEEYYKTFMELLSPYVQANWSGYSSFQEGFDNRIQRMKDRVSEKQFRFIAAGWLLL